MMELTILKNLTVTPKTRRYLSGLVYAAAGAGIMGLAAIAEHAMGRRPWGISGRPGLWSGDIQSEHNSQYVADPYSFTHLTHGFLLYGLTWLIGGRLPIGMRGIIAIAIESAWEVFENTNFVINRYRVETVSLHYYGDSIVNSMSDILFCMGGFVVAAILPARMTIVAALLLELALTLYIRDSLALNVIMLVRPVQIIRDWQLAK